MRLWRYLRHLDRQAYEAGLNERDGRFYRSEFRFSMFFVAWYLALAVFLIVATVEIAMSGD